MLAALRLKEKILLLMTIIFIPSYTFYSQFIAPRFSDNRFRVLERQLTKERKDLSDEETKDRNIKTEIEAIKQKQRINDEQIVKMRAEADEFKKYILSDRYEVELYQYLFGRDARYNVIDLGNNPRRLPKGAFTEIIYTYQVRGAFADVLKMVKKIENTSRSLSISTLKLEKPRINPKEGQKDDGSVISNLQIHVILSSQDNALSFEEFRKGAPELEIKKIDGNPWDPNFGAASAQDEGPTGPVKKLFLSSVLYMIENQGRVARFEGDQNWYKEGDEFDIEAGKSFTRVRLIAIGGRYVIVKHLNKNITYKITLNVTDGESADAKDNPDRNIKTVISDESGL
ncbi:MAG: hypothetical protein H3C47_09765 [Candidatus Cloacimonetes bacterium]|nr:hypothetical protein [Candidatus Cloacimonadota bacterium]